MAALVSALLGTASYLYLVAVLKFRFRCEQAAAAQVAAAAAKAVADQQLYAQGAIDPPEDVKATVSSFLYYSPASSCFITLQPRVRWYTSL